MKFLIFSILFAAVVLSSGNPVPESELIAPTKPGSCPAGPPVVGTCAITLNSCQADGQCPADQKCCTNGCGKVCVSIATAPTLPQPVRTEKPGASPVNDNIGVCVITENSCNHDGQCNGDLKCCSTGCGKSCVSARTRPPVPQPQPQPQPSQAEKPGTCPPNDSFGICAFDPAKNCLSDSVCPGSEKCCPNGCNRICTALPRKGPAPVQFAQ